MPLIPKGTNPLVQLPEVLAVGFSGHRKVPYEAKSRQVIRDFLARQKESHHGILIGVSSAAAGGDQLFAESCIELKIPLRILLPRPCRAVSCRLRRSLMATHRAHPENAISVEVTGGSTKPGMSNTTTAAFKLWPRASFWWRCGTASPRAAWAEPRRLSTYAEENWPSYRLDSQRDRRAQVAEHRSTQTDRYKLRAGFSQRAAGRGRLGARGRFSATWRRLARKSG